MKLFRALNKASKAIGRGLRAVGGGSLSGGARAILGATPLGPVGAIAAVKGANVLGSKYRKYVKSKMKPGQSASSAIRKLAAGAQKSVFKAGSHLGTGAMSVKRAGSALAKGDVSKAFQHMRRAVNKGAHAYRGMTRAVKRVRG